jgi:hypothetical protein
MATISKKAAAELTDLLASKDTANILYQWYVDQERDGGDVDSSLMVKRIECKIQIIEIEIRLHDDFGIVLFDMDHLSDSLADYSEMLDSVLATISREAAA